eukprot:6183652-Pleurochrysis_carterae.AAC.2
MATGCSLLWDKVRTLSIRLAPAYKHAFGIKPPGWFYGWTLVGLMELVWRAFKYKHIFKWLNFTYKMT